MQTKLTLRMEAELIEGAKKIAEARNVSLSRMVADFFSSLGQKESRPGFENLPPKTRALHGALSKSGTIDAKADYREFLAGKYS